MESQEVGEGWSQPVHQNRSRETRDRILAAAETVFAEKGYDGARMVDIAEAAGCSIGALYARFKDKDALFGGIVEAFSAESSNRLANLALVTDPGFLARRFVHGMAAQFHSHRGLFRAIVERGAENLSALAPLMAGRANLEKFFAETLRRAYPDDPRDFTLTVRVVFQIVMGFLLNPAINPLAPTAGDETRAIAELESAVLRYLKLE